MDGKEKSVFKCLYCEKCFSRASNRSRHMKTAHQKNSRGEHVSTQKFTCVLCDKDYTTKSSLQHHLDTVHLLSDKSYKCIVCPYESKHKGVVNRHMFKVHRPYITKKSVEKLKVGLKCSRPKCSSYFNSENNLRHHVNKKHTSVPSSIKRKCPLCSFCSLKKTKKEITEHFYKAHKIRIKPIKYNFLDFEKFTEWKEQLEVNTSSSFVKASYGQPKALHFLCHRRGYFKTKGHNIRHIKMSGSCKINAYCPCEIHVRINEDGSVSVVHYPIHVGHKNDLKFIKLPAADKKVVVSQLLSKTPHDEILRRLRRTPLTNNELQRIHLLNKKDLINMEQSFNINSEEIRHKFDPVSVEAWVNELKSSENTALIVYKPQGLYDCAYQQLRQDDFLLIFMTKAQQSLLERFGHNIISIDGTHGVNSYNFQLYTLLTLDETREGIPCAFMFTNRGDESTLSLFFESVKSVTGPIKPEIFMSDMEEAFYLAWNKTMGQAGLRLFCTWHVLRAWRGNLCKIRNKEKKEAVYKMLKTLLYEVDCLTFESILPAALNKLKSDVDTIEYHNYFYDHYVKNGRYKLWAYCYRTHCGINTNMSLENFNRVLKHCYLRGKKVQRLDKTLHAILNLISDKLFDYMIKIEKGKLVSKLQIMRRRHKQTLRIPENNVTYDDKKWTVLSASVNEFYFVKKVQDCKKCQLQCLHCRSCFHEFICTCLDNSIKNNMCKHIHAVCRTLKNDCGPNEDSMELIMDVDDNKISVQDTILKEISNSCQSNKVCKEDLEVLWKQLIEATTTNEEVSFVKKTLKETIATINAMKDTANRPLVGATQMKRAGKIEHQKRFYSLKKNAKPQAKFTNQERNQIALDLLQNHL